MTILEGINGREFMAIAICTALAILIPLWLLRRKIRHKRSLRIDLDFRRAKEREHDPRGSMGE